MGDRARGLTSSTRGSWRGREPSIESIDRSVEWRLSGVCGVTRRRMHPRRDRAHSSSTSGAVVEAARRDATRRDARRAGGTF